MGRVIDTYTSYILILDIFCQHLGDICQLEGFCASFGRRIGGMILKIYIFVMDKVCQLLGNTYTSVEVIHWSVSVRPGHRAQGTGLWNVDCI